MSDTTVQVETTETTVREPRLKITVDWKALGKKVALFSAAALAGAAIYAIVTDESDSDDVDVDDTDAPVTE